MILRLVAGLAVIAGFPGEARSQSAEQPIVTAAPSGGESVEALRDREAAAYAQPLPRGAPTQDYPLVAWCEALVNGHIALGESLTSGDPLDAEIIRLGKLEAVDFRSALSSSAGRQTPATRTAADAAAADAAGKWVPLMQLDEPGRSQAFGLFYGLPGRCEHAARRIRENITAAPAQLPEATAPAAATRGQPTRN